jgi:hypothetical protein
MLGREPDEPPRGRAAIDLSDYPVDANYPRCRLLIAFVLLGDCDGWLESGCQNDGSDPGDDTERV